MIFVLWNAALLHNNSSLARQAIFFIDILSHHVFHNIDLSRPLILMFHWAKIESLQIFLVFLILISLMLLMRLLSILNPIIDIVSQPSWQLLGDLLLLIVFILEKHALFLGLEPFILLLEGKIIDYLRYIKFAILFEMFLNKQILQVRDRHLLFFVIMLYEQLVETGMQLLQFALHERWDVCWRIQRGLQVYLLEEGLPEF